jgi:CMP/dCMP kinase
MKKIVIAIDGYSACGKSSTAKALAQVLGYAYIDTGAMYRAVTLYFHENHVAITNPREVRKALDQIHIHFAHNQATGVSETFLNGLNVEKKIRLMHISERVSEVSTLAEVREAMVAQQRKMGRKKGVVMDGRDIGTVVFPEAELKIFMVADFAVRAARRQEELLEMGQMVDIPVIMENLKKRDHIDSTRKESPLRQADDAVIIDTTYLAFEEQLDECIQLATSRMIHFHQESAG